MLQIWLIFFMAQVLMVLSCIDESTVCTQWGLTQQNECISMPEIVPCRCRRSCSSIAECDEFGETNDTDCNCRQFAMNGTMDENQMFYKFLCPTTFMYRVTSGVNCRDKPPDRIGNAKVDGSTLKATYRYMDQVKYNCVNGYSFSGYSRPTVTCNFDGRWHLATNAGNGTCDVLSINDDNMLEEIDEFKPNVKEAQGAAVLGLLGMLIVICLIGGIVCLDWMSRQKHVARCKRNTRQFRRWIRRKKREHTPVQDLKSNNKEIKSDNDISIIVSECSYTNKDETATRNKIELKNKIISSKVLKITKENHKAGHIRSINSDISKSFVNVKHSNKPLISVKHPAKTTPTTQLQLNRKMKTTIV